MEAERKAAGLEGVRFLYYHCPGCGIDDIFVDVLPLEGEAHADYLKRRDAMEAAVRQLHVGPTKAEAVVVTREP
jgi:DNA polymerase II small subunit/DNA polymerase delta subunit B